MPSKKIDKLGKKISKVFKGKEEPVIVKEDITADMRKNAQIIMGILSATDIEQSKLSDEIKADIAEGCIDCEEELHRLNLIDELENAPAISDDMRKIDEHLVRFAEIYKESAESGSNLAFHWAGNALAKGIELRKNLRHEDEEFRLKDFDHRLQQMETYENLVICCKAIDEAIKVDAQGVAKYHACADTFNGIRHKIIDYIATPEGGAIQNELDNNSRQANGIWSDEARTLNSWYNDVVRAEMDVIRSAIWMDENKETLANRQSMLQEIRAALRSDSGIYDKKLQAEFDILLDKQQKLFEETQQRNVDIREKMHAHTRAMKTVATESDAAKVREFWREDAKRMVIEYAEKDKIKIEAGPSPYANLKQEIIETVKNEQRITNDM